MGLKGGHHWFPQKPAFQEKIRKLCSPDKLCIHDFTNPGVDDMSKGTIHYYLHHVLDYNSLFEKVLNSATSCCDLLSGTFFLMNYAKKLVRMEFGTVPEGWDKLYDYRSDDDKTNDFYKLVADECKDKGGNPAPPEVHDALKREYDRLLPKAKNREDQSRKTPRLEGPPSDAEKRAREEFKRRQTEQWWWKSPFFFFFGPGGDVVMIDPDGKMWPTGNMWNYK